MEVNAMTYYSIDLFSGPGGICTGFKWADIKPLIAVEFSYWTVQTYAKNHDADIFPLDDYLNNTLDNVEDYFKENDRTILIYGDITKVSNDLIDRFLQNRFGVQSVDIVTGGAPCESFSMAGARKQDDDRNNLFLNILRIARHLDTPMVVFENVKGLFSKKADGIKGQMFENICEEFEREDVDTGVSYQLASKNKETVLLKASNYGIPQNRERIFLVAINKKYHANFQYPAVTHGPESSYSYVTTGDALLDLPPISSGEGSDEMNYDDRQLNERLLDSQEAQQRKDFLEKMRGISLPALNHHQLDVITSHKAVNHRPKMLKRMSFIHQGESMKSAAERLVGEGREEVRDSYFPKKLYGARNRRLSANQSSFTVTSHCLDEMIHPFIDRGLTPREAARIQSFPDWYHFEGPYVKFHSDPEQDRYEQIGDAIPPLLAYVIAKEVSKSLDVIYSKNGSLIEQFN